MSDENFEPGMNALTSTVVCLPGKEGELLKVAADLAEGTGELPEAHCDGFNVLLDAVLDRNLGGAARSNRSAMRALLDLKGLTGLDGVSGKLKDLMGDDLDAVVARLREALAGTGILSDALRALMRKELIRGQLAPFMLTRAAILHRLKNAVQALKDPLMELTLNPKAGAAREGMSLLASAKNGPTSELYDALVREVITNSIEPVDMVKLAETGKNMGLAYRCISEAIHSQLIARLLEELHSDVSLVTPSDKLHGHNTHPHADDWRSLRDPDMGKWEFSLAHRNDEGLRQIKVEARLVPVGEIKNAYKCSGLGVPEIHMPGIIEKLNTHLKRNGIPYQIGEVNCSKVSQRGLLSQSVPLVDSFNAKLIFEEKN
ncbi:MAG: hypothetical protein WC882_01090 [Candidatus Gracilibacteria bacterium]